MRERLAAVASQYQRSSCPGVCCQLHIAGLVADHPGTCEIDVMRARRLVQHSWLRLPAPARLPVSLASVVRMVRAIVDRIYSRAFVLKLADHSIVNRAKFAFTVQPSSDARLVRHHDRLEPGFVDEPQSFGNERIDFEFVWR